MAWRSMDEKPYINSAQYYINDRDHNYDTQICNHQCKQITVKIKMCNNQYNPDSNSNCGSDYNCDQGWNFNYVCGNDKIVIIAAISVKIVVVTKILITAVSVKILIMGVIKIPVTIIIWL